MYANRFMLLLNRNKLASFTVHVIQRSIINDEQHCSNLVLLVAPSLALLVILNLLKMLKKLTIYITINN